MMGNKVDKVDKKLVEDFKFLRSNLELNISTLEAIIKQFDSNYVSKFDIPNIINNFKNKNLNELLIQSYVQLRNLKVSIDLFISSHKISDNYYQDLLKEEKIKTFFEVLNNFYCMLNDHQIKNNSNNEEIEKTLLLIINFDAIIHKSENVELDKLRSRYIDSSSISKKYDNNKMETILFNVNENIDKIMDKNKNFEEVQKIYLQDEENKEVNQIYSADEGNKSNNDNIIVENHIQNKNCLESKVNLNNEEIEMKNSHTCSNFQNNVEIIQKKEVAEVAEVADPLVNENTEKLKENENIHS